MRRADEAWAIAAAARRLLDDIGRNLKPARALGMATIKVNDPVQALRDLSALLGMDLGRPH